MKIYEAVLLFFMRLISVKNCLLYTYVIKSCYLIYLHNFQDFVMRTFEIAKK